MDSGNAVPHHHTKPSFPSSQRNPAGKEMIFPCPGELNSRALRIGPDHPERRESTRMLCLVTHQLGIHPPLASALQDMLPLFTEGRISLPPRPVLPDHVE